MQNEREYNRKRMNEWRKNNPEKAKAQWDKDRQKNRAKRNEYMKEWHKKNRGSLEYKKKRKEILKKYYLKNRHKIYARTKLKRAIQGGALNRPTECSKCGLEGKIEAHHEDYLKPLEVIWLCQQCHRKV